MKKKTLQKLERAINGKLKQIEPNYGVRNLTRTPDGKYVFDLKVAIDPRHFFKIREVLKSVLSQLPVEESVQAKFYLPRSLYSTVREKAAAAGVSQSAYVAQCLSKSV
jgi:hypothetical protein